jgi:muramoyltetrapeptide carboxypeptidase
LPDLVKPRALAPGDRVAIIAPASPFARDEFDAGLTELRQLGFQPVYTDAVFERRDYVAGAADVRARDLLAAWSDSTVRAVIAARGGYGSVQLLPLLDAELIRRDPKVFLGFSDNTSILTWLVQSIRLVAFHGPMIERRFAGGAAGYDRDTFMRCLCRAEPVGEIQHPNVESLRDGEAEGRLVGGTLTQLVSSLGTPFAFDPPAGCILFVDEIAERPYRLDRMLTQLRFSGLLSRAAGIVFNELPRCDEPGGQPTARDTVRNVLADFPGPILFGLPSGHTDGPTLTLPFGVKARLIAGPQPAVVIEEAAVS